MRRGNILEGIRAGFQAYMQGRQFGAQMDTNKLQQEQMKLAGQMYQNQLRDYMSPEQKAAWQKQHELDTAEALWKQGHELGDPRYMTAEEQLAHQKRLYDAQYAAMDKYRTSGSRGAEAGAGGLSLFGKNFMDFTEVHSFFRALADAEGYKAALPLHVIDEMTKYGEYGPPGIEYARRVIWREKLLDENRHWLSQLGQDDYKNVYAGLMLSLFQQSKTYDEAGKDMDEALQMYRNAGKVEQSGIPEFLYTHYPREELYKAGSWVRRNMPWLEKFNEKIGQVMPTVNLENLPYESLDSYMARQERATRGQFARAGGGGGGSGQSGAGLSTFTPMAWGQPPAYAPVGGMPSGVSAPLYDTRYETGGWPVWSQQNAPPAPSWFESNESPYQYDMPLYPLEQANIPSGHIERDSAYRIISERGNDWITQLPGKQQERYIQMIVSLLRENKSQEEIQAVLDAAYKRHIAQYR